MDDKKPNSSPYRNIKWFCLALLIADLVFIYFMPRSILYSRNTTIYFLSMFIVSPLMAFLTVTAFTGQKGVGIGVALLSLVIVGLSSSLIGQYRQKAELREFGVWTKAVVIGRNSSVGGRDNSGHWMIRCQYTANGQTYKTFAHDDLKNAYQFGDTVDLIYSRQYPEIYALGYEWKK